MDFTIQIAVIGVLIVIAAIYAIRAKNLLVAIISAGVISLLASVIYILLASPDVAMTEAAIGSALTTIVFLYTLKKVKSEGANEIDREDEDD
ncbi:MAG: Na(+)/H(+) antiporter subunit B [Candidatus Zixiibacteriota bacterium]